MNISDLKKSVRSYFETAKPYLPSAETTAKVVGAGATLAAAAYCLGMFYMTSSPTTNNPLSFFEFANNTLFKCAPIKGLSHLRPLATSVVNASHSLFQSVNISETIATTTASKAQQIIAETTSQIADQTQNISPTLPAWINAPEIAQPISDLYAYLGILSALGAGLLPFVLSRICKKKEPNQNLPPENSSQKRQPIKNEEIDFDEKTQIPLSLNPDPEFLSALQLVNPETIGDPATSKIHLIGDIHNRPSILRAQKAILKKMARDGDVILVESNQQLVMLNPKKISWTKELLKDIWVMGWDDLNSIIEANMITKELVESEDILKKPNLDPLTLQIKSLHFAKLVKKMNRYDLINRNNSLEKTVRKVRSHIPEKRIFVIAGQSHLNSQLIENIAIQNREEPCLTLFHPPEEEEKNHEHLDQIISETSASALKIDRLIHFYPSGPCTLRIPKRPREDLRPPKEPNTRTNIESKKYLYIKT